MINIENTRTTRTISCWWGNSLQSHDFDFYTFPNFQRGKIFSKNPKILCLFVEFDSCKFYCTTTKKVYHWWRHKGLDAWRGFINDSSVTLHKPWFLTSIFSLLQLWFFKLILLLLQKRRYNTHSFIHLQGRLNISAADCFDIDLGRKFEKKDANPGSNSHSGETKLWSDAHAPKAAFVRMCVFMEALNKKLLATP